MWPSGPELVRTPSNVAQGQIKQFIMFKIIEKPTDQEFRFSVTTEYSNPSLKEVMSWYSIEDKYYHWLAQKVNHLTTNAGGEIVLLLPELVTRSACQSFVDHVYSLLDPFIAIS